MRRPSCRFWVFYALILSVLLASGPVARAQRVRKALPTLRTPSTVRDSTRADSVKRRLVQLDQQKIIDSLRALSRRRTVLGRAASVVFDFRVRRDDDDGLDAALLDRQYDRHRYKIVRRVELRRLDPFGYSIENLGRVPTRFWEKAGNGIHVRTHNGVIRRVLLFRNGEQLDPQALAESERLLRATPFIGDARILVNEASTTDDSVDVIVITRDVFSLGVSAAAAPGSSVVDAGVSDDNFLGLGHQVNVDYGQGYDRPDPQRLRATYAVANLGPRFVTGQARFRSEYGLRTAGLSLERGFVTPATRWAGAARFDWYDERVGYQYVASAKDPPLLPHAVYGVQDYWLGRAYALRSYDLARTNRARFITAGRVISTTFAQRPTEGAAGTNHTLLLSAVGLSFRRYYKDRYFFGFGRTEDIPAGNLFTLTAGVERGGGQARPYYAAQFAFGHYRRTFGYLYGGAGLSSYRRGTRWQQALLTAEALYFSPLTYLGTWRFRNVLWLRTSLGFRRDSLELLSINKTEGLRGFSSGVLRGQRRLVFNYEADFFTPLSLLGFRVAPLLFCDVAWLAPTSHTSPLQSKPYAGIGLGLRLRNDYIAFRTIQLLLGYYPRLPPGEDLQQLRIYEAARPYVPFRDFGFSQPVTSDFR